MKSTDSESVHNFITKVLSFGKRKPKTRDHYARFNRRMLAATIDSIILLLFLPLINRLAPIDTASMEGYTIDPEDPQAGQHLLLHVLGNQQFLQSWFTNFFMQMLFWCVFSAIFLHFFSATPGKMVLRMKVVNAEDEGRINDLQVFLRSFGYLVSSVFFGLGFFWISFNKRRRGWHDILADTVVINLPVQFWKKSP